MIHARSSSLLAVLQTPSSTRPALSQEVNPGSLSPAATLFPSSVCRAMPGRAGRAQSPPSTAERATRSGTNLKGMSRARQCRSHMYRKSMSASIRENDMSAVHRTPISD
ncbi:hypothetical protein BV20DRAFT_630861 [Pilatotrama ljubarskyi]|nr:hypothetical protein BV20DRAFT_630861 [Pilatotrama ljubarskyi]